jgi:hypothetical protein
MVLTLITTLLGTLTGLLGNFLTTWSSLKLEKMKNDHELAKMKEERETIRAEAEANIKITEAVTEGQIQLAETDAFKESLKGADKQLFDISYMPYLMKSKWTSWMGALLMFMFATIDVIVHSVRPFVTYYMIGASTWLTILCYKLVNMTGALFTAAQAFDLFNMVINTMLYLTSSAVGWWFADRQTAKNFKKINELKKPNTDFVMLSNKK